MATPALGIRNFYPGLDREAVCAIDGSSSAALPEKIQAQLFQQARETQVIKGFASVLAALGINLAPHPTVQSAMA
jgi:hypothetical protein